MTVRERILEARLAEKANKNPILAKQLGIEIEQKKSIDSNNKEIRPADSMK